MKTLELKLSCLLFKIQAYLFWCIAQLSRCICQSAGSAFARPGPALVPSRGQEWGNCQQQWLDELWHGWACLKPCGLDSLTLPQFSVSFLGRINALSLLSGSQLPAAGLACCRAGCGFYHYYFLFLIFLAHITVACMAQNQTHFVPKSASFISLFVTVMNYLAELCTSCWFLILGVLFADPIKLIGFSDLCVHSCVSYIK